MGSERERRVDNKPGGSVHVSAQTGQQVSLLMPFHGWRRGHEAARKHCLTDTPDEAQFKPSSEGSRAEMQCLVERDDNRKCQQDVADGIVLTPAEQIDWLANEPDHGRVGCGNSRHESATQQHCRPIRQRVRGETTIGGPQMTEGTYWLFTGCRVGAQILGDLGWEVRSGSRNAEFINARIYGFIET